MQEIHILGPKRNFKILYLCIFTGPPFGESKRDIKGCTCVYTFVVKYAFSLPVLLIRENLKSYTILENLACL